MKQRLLLLLVFFCFSTLQAQEDVNLFSRFASWRENSMMRGCDSTYISLPDNAWTFKVNGIFSFSNLSLHFNEFTDFEHFDINIGSGVGFKSSFALAYRGLELGYTMDQTNRYNHDIKLNLYNKRFGGELQYQSYRNTTSTFNAIPDTSFKFQNDYINRLTVNAYYVFNYSGFSYPAAITQAYIQKKSAGSFLLGATFFHNTTKPFPNTNSFAESFNPLISNNQFSIGAGYGYNYIGHKIPVLLHFSAMPMASMTINEVITDGNTGEAINNDNKFHITPALTARAATCYTYQERLILGFNCVYNYYSTSSDEKFNLTSNGWMIQCCIGWRFL